MTTRAQRSCPRPSAPAAASASCAATRSGGGRKGVRRMTASARRKTSTLSLDQGYGSAAGGRSSFAPRAGPPPARGGGSPAGWPPVEPVTLLLHLAERLLERRDLLPELLPLENEPRHERSASANSRRRREAPFRRSRHGPQSTDARCSSSKLGGDARRSRTGASRREPRGDRPRHGPPSAAAPARPGGPRRPAPLSAARGRRESARPAGARSGGRRRRAAARPAAAARRRSTRPAPPARRAAGAKPARTSRATASARLGGLEGATPRSMRTPDSPSHDQGTRQFSRTFTPGISRSGTHERGAGQVLGQLLDQLPHGALGPERAGSGAEGGEQPPPALGGRVPDRGEHGGRRRPAAHVSRNRAAKPSSVRSAVSSSTAWATSSKGRGGRVSAAFSVTGTRVAPVGLGRHRRYTCVLKGRVDMGARLVSAWPRSSPSRRWRWRARPRRSVRRRARDSRPSASTTGSSCGSTTGRSPATGSGRARSTRTSTR